MRYNCYICCGMTLKEAAFITRNKYSALIPLGRTYCSIHPYEGWHHFEGFGVVPLVCPKQWQIKAVTQS